MAGFPLVSFRSVFSIFLMGLTESCAWMSLDRGGGFSGMGNLAENGLGMEKDYILARKLYQKAIKLEFCEGYSGMGSLFEHGRGVQSNLKKALYYYKISVKMEGYRGEIALGNFYRDGTIVKQDDELEISHL